MMFNDVILQLLFNNLAVIGCNRSGVNHEYTFFNEICHLHRGSLKATDNE